MISASNLFQYGLLSEAAYALLRESDEAIGGNDLALLLESAGSGPSGKAWPATLADEFVKHWRVVSHRPNTATGFSATLYERLDEAGDPTGQFVLSPRGTEPTLDSYFVDLQEDVGNIVANGLAWEQIIDLYNYWQEISTAAGVTYLRARVEWVASAEAEARIAAGEMGFVQETFTASGNEYPVYWKILVEDSGQQGRGLVSAGTTIDLAGHSLGGHLAMAFSRLFPAATGSVLSVNGAGFRDDMLVSDNVKNVFAGLGGASAFDYAKILNVYGEAGWEIITQNTTAGLYQPGNHRPIYIEDAVGHVLGHGGDQMSDSLAAYDLFIRLDPSLASASIAYAISRIRPYIDAVSDDDATTFETTVDMLRKSLGLPVLATNDPDNRAKYYEAVVGLTNDPTFKALAGKVTLQTPVAVASTVRYDFGHFLALYHVTPFALKTTDASALSALKDANLLISTLWDADRSLVAGRQHFSDEWITDRGKLLDWFTKAGTADDTTLAGPQLDANWTFFDKGTDTTVEVDSAAFLSWWLPEHSVQFGGSGLDTLDGGEGTDRMYGGDGGDTITGAGRHDYLEGNAGNDIIRRAA